MLLASGSTTVWHVVTPTLTPRKPIHSTFRQVGMDEWGQNKLPVRYAGQALAGFAAFADEATARALCKRVAESGSDLTEAHFPALVAQLAWSGSPGADAAQSALPMIGARHGAEVAF